VILSRVVLRWLDALHKPRTRPPNRVSPLAVTTGRIFYNVSPHTLQSLRSSAAINQQRLLSNFEDYIICSRNSRRDLTGKCALATKAAEGNSFRAFTTVFRSLA
jgi:hypothetical protein